MKKLGSFLAIFLFCTPSVAAGVVWQSAKTVGVRSCCEGDPQFLINGGAASLHGLKDVISLQEPKDPLVAAWAGAFELRAQAKTSGRARVDIRLSIDKAEQSEVVVVTTVGGKSQTRRFLYGAKGPGSIIISQSQLMRDKPLEIVIQILASRDATTEPVLVSLESLDVGSYK